MHTKSKLLQNLSKGVISLFLILIIFISSIGASSVSAVGFTDFKLTNNDRDDYGLVSAGKYVVWFQDLDGTNSDIYFADILSGRSGQAANDPKVRKELAVSPEGIAVWTEGSGTATNIVGYHIANNSQFGVAGDQASNESPRISGIGVAFTKVVGGKKQVHYNDIYNGAGTEIRVSATANDQTNPRITTASSGEKVVFWEEGNDIKYWDTGSQAVKTARNGGSGCVDTLGEANPINADIAFTETCSGNIKAYFFEAGSDIDSTSDDDVTRMSDDDMDEAFTPVLSEAGGDLIGGWREGSSTSIIALGEGKGNCGILGLLCLLGGLLNLGGDGGGSSSSLLNDKPTMAEKTIVWQRHNANQTIDVLGYDKASDTEFTVATNATLESLQSISEVGTTGKVWGGIAKFSEGEPDKDIHVLVPKITTPTGSNVLVSFGNNSKITFQNVSQSGETTFIVKSLFSVPDQTLSQFKLGASPRFFDIHTTATWSGTATVCLEYDPNILNNDESLLQILHNEGGTWVDRTTSIDATNNVVCAGVTSFSEVAFAFRDPTIISGLEPAQGDGKSATSIIIKGSGFMEGARLVFSNADSFKNYELQNIEFVDKNTLKAVVPAGIAPGKYNLTLENRYGAGAFLTDAFSIPMPNFGELKALITQIGLSDKTLGGINKELEQGEKALTNGKVRQALSSLKEIQRTLERIAKNGTDGEGKQAKKVNQDKLNASVAYVQSFIDHLDAQPKRGFILELRQSLAWAVGGAIGGILLSQSGVFVFATEIFTGKRRKRKS